MRETIDMKENTSDLWALILSIAAFVLSAATFAYTTYTSEFGIVWGKADHKLEVRDRLSISNGIGSLALSSDLLVRNDGTRPFRLQKTKAMVWLGSVQKEFESKALLEVNPKSSWRGNLSYYIDMSDGEWGETLKLGTDIKMYLLRELYKKKKIEEVVFLSPELIGRIEKALNNNISWLKEHDEYYIMFGYWINDDVVTPSVVQLYKFKIRNPQIETLSKIQLESIEAPSEGIIDKNKSLSWAITPQVSRITDQRLIDSRYAEFKRTFVE